jgi:hypothetical protein
MAVVAASANGGWSSPATWTNGISPTSVDDVRANGFTVYIDQNIAVNSLSTPNGGTFRNVGNLTATAYSFVSAGTTTCINITGNGTNICTISAGSIHGTATTASIYAIYMAESNTPATLITYGRIVGGSVGSTEAVRIGSGNYSHFGFISAGSNTNSHGINVFNSQNMYSRIYVSGGPVIGGTGNSASGIALAYYTVGSSLSASYCIVDVRSSFISGGLTTPGGTQAGVTINSNIPVSALGPVYGGNGSYGIYHQGLGVCTVSGNVYSGTIGTPGGYGAQLQNIGNLTIIGDVYAMPTTNSSYGIGNGSTGTINVTGNVYGAPYGNGGSGWYCTNHNRNTLVGNVSGGGVTNAYGINMNNNGYVTVYGNVSGGPGGSANGIQLGGNGYVIVYGSVTPNLTAVSHGVYIGSTGTAYVKRARASSYGPGVPTSQTGTGYGVYGNTQAATIYVEELEFGSRGCTPVYGNVFIKDFSTNAVTFTTSTSAGKTLIDPNSGSIVPPVSSVRYGTLYSSGNLSGTCVVPSISSVDFGTSVDTSTGITALFANDIWNTNNNTLTAASLSGTIGYRLINVSTTESAGQTLAAYTL